MKTSASARPVLLIVALSLGSGFGCGANQDSVSSRQRLASSEQCSALRHDVCDCSGRSNNGHGNNADGVDVSNPGQGGGGPNGRVDPSGSVDDEILGHYPNGAACTCPVEGDDPESNPPDGEDQESDPNGGSTLPDDMSSDPCGSPSDGDETSETPRDTNETGGGTADDPNGGSTTDTGTDPGSSDTGSTTDTGSSPDTGSTPSDVPLADPGSVPDGGACVDSSECSGGICAADGFCRNL